MPRALLDFTLPLFPLPLLRAWLVKQVMHDEALPSVDHAILQLSLGHQVGGRLKRDVFGFRFACACLFTCAKLSFSGRYG